MSFRHLIDRLYAKGSEHVELEQSPHGAGGNGRHHGHDRRGGCAERRHDQHHHHAGGHGRYLLFPSHPPAAQEGQEGQGIWHNEYESEIEISSTEEERKDVSENENITFRVLDGKEISVSRDRLMDTGRINNRWSLEETDAMIAPLKGTWTTNTYMGYVLPYNLRKFEPDTYADEEARETFFGEYHEAVRAAEESPVPDISVEVQPMEEYEDGYTIRVNGYESPFSIILSTERINDEYPIYSDTTTLSEKFFVEYPVVYIKLFASFKDGESDRYNPVTVIVSEDGQVLLLMEGAFYSLERR